jgi:hypothetical protein
MNYHHQVEGLADSFEALQGAASPPSWLPLNWQELPALMLISSSPASTENITRLKAMAKSCEPLQAAASPASWLPWNWYWDP